MSGPRPGSTALVYHEATKHSPHSIRRGGRQLDWSTKPNPFKPQGTDGVRLPREVGSSRVAALAALSEIAPPRGRQLTGVTELARLLLLGAGVLRTRRFGYDDAIHFRTYASAGALYPNEVYVVSGEMNGLDAGVYHYDPLGHRLGRIRHGDERGRVVRATAGESSVACAQAVLVITAIPWRTAWKYGERGYRHVFWDAGMIVANVLALAASNRLPARVVVGFVDTEVDALLGVDGENEFSCCLLALGVGASVRPAPEPPPPLIDLRGSDGAPERFPGIEQANDAGCLATPEEVEHWRTGVSVPGTYATTSGEDVVVAPADPTPDPVDDVIRRRGSSRAFGRASMPAAVFAGILEAATKRAETDYDLVESVRVQPYVIANAVEGLAPGAYVYEANAFRPLRLGQLRREAGYLCLEQRLGADAAATVFLMTDLGAVIDAFGDRGYRVAQLEGAIAAGKMYLAAYAHRFGATGLTFYDDEVTRFFSPHAAGKSCILVVAMGESTRRLLPTS